MTYNEAIIEARDLVERTNKSWYILKDYQGDYSVSSSSEPLITLSAVVHPNCNIKG